MFVGQAVAALQSPNDEYIPIVVFEAAFDDEQTLAFDRLYPA